MRVSDWIKTLSLGLGGKAAAVAYPEFRLGESRCVAGISGVLPLRVSGSFAQSAGTSAISWSRR